MAGQLMVIPTPIGNREDITLRAVRLLKEADMILCEDTRHSGPLMSYYGISAPLVSYHEHNEKSRTEEVLNWIKEGQNVALISDAGMPCISDPGSVLIQAVIRAGLEMTVLPGPSAGVTALVLSGYAGGPFYFHGFLSRRNKERREEKEFIESMTCPVILYESPYRLKETLKELQEIMPHRPVAVIRELTKVYEERIGGESPEEVLTKLSEPVKGEIVLVLGPGEKSEVEVDGEALLREKLKQGLSISRAVKDVAQETGLKRNELYDISLKIKEEDHGIPFETDD